MGLCLLVKDAEHINKKKETQREKMFTYNEKANLASCQKGHNIWHEINASKEGTSSWFMTDLELTLSFRIWKLQKKNQKDKSQAKQDPVHKKLCEPNFLLSIVLPPSSPAFRIFGYFL